MSGTMTGYSSTSASCQVQANKYTQIKNTDFGTFIPIACPGNRTSVCKKAKDVDLKQQLSRKSHAVSIISSHGFPVTVFRSMVDRKCSLEIVIEHNRQTNIANNKTISSSSYEMALVLLYLSYQIFPDWTQRTLPATDHGMVLQALKKKYLTISFAFRTRLSNMVFAVGVDTP